MNKDILTSLLRQILTFFGGVAVSQGLVDGETANALAGSIPVVISATWSIFDKKTRQK